MDYITLYGNQYANVTIVSNEFIDVYMKLANDAQIKIYLHLLRCLSGGKPVSISSIADEFNYPEKDVMRALRYWEKQGLLSLDFNETQALSGIHMDHPAPAASPESTPLLQAKPQPAAPQAPVRPAYTADRLNDFKSREEIVQLLFIAEQYLGKTLSATEVSSFLYMYDSLSFSAELIEYLVEYCVSNKKKSIRYMEKVALAWAEDGITTVEQAKAHNELYSKEVFDVLKAFGISGRNPVPNELSYIKKWTKEFGFSTNIILEACERTMKNTLKPSFAYADNILKGWHTQQVKNLQDIRTLDEDFHKSREHQPKPAKLSTATKFNNFTPHTYNFTELEEQLLQR